MRRDERLIDLFLKGYRDGGGNLYRLAERPDRIERVSPAIDGIAVNERGEALCHRAHSRGTVRGPKG
jgi:hypothetical protein